jgi:hypothetical protein
MPDVKSINAGTSRNTRHGTVLRCVGAGLQRAARARASGASVRRSAGVACGAEAPTSEAPDTCFDHHPMDGELLLL